MSKNFVTFHILNDLPWHNMNRDEHGAPKQFLQGGARRGMLSSQSLKRAARIAYEKTVGNDITFRSSTGLPNLVMRRVNDLAAESGTQINEKVALAEITKTIKALVTNKDTTEKDKSETSAEDEGTAGRNKDKEPKDTNVWLSADEVGVLAERAFAKATGNLEGDLVGELGAGRRIGALGIAAFGRMFANASDRQTDAAIAVSPAVTTHKLNIAIDHFTVANDLPSRVGSRAASFLDVAQYTSGVYYRSFTIDRAQLHRSWSDISAPDAPQRLEALLRSLVYSLPTGKSNSTAPYTVPLVVMAEEQTVRQAYSFETPVPLGDDGGFTDTSIERLAAERTAAANFDPALFGNAYINGTVNNIPTIPGVTPVDTLDDILNKVVTWALSDGDSK